MKRLFLIILTIFILHSQWSSIEHAFHDHAAGDVCVTCLSTQSLDDALFTSFQPVSLGKKTCRQERLNLELISTKRIRNYTVRAPPGFI